MRFIALLAFAAAFLVTGCTSNTAVLRIVEYSADAPMTAITGSGVAVHQSGAEHAFARVSVIYQGERAAIQITTGAEAE